MLRHPGDAFSLAILGALATLTVVNVISPLATEPENIANFTLLVGSALAINLTLRHARGKDEAGATRDLRQEVHGLKDRIGAYFGDEVSQVAAIDIASRLDEQLSHATAWSFRGGSGRWQRREALPRLGHEGRGVNTRYVMQILDPRDEDLCQRYATYRFAQRRKADRRAEEGRAVTVRDDLLACIFAVGWYDARARIDGSVFLMPLYSPLRIDAGSSGLVLSVANPDAPAMYAPAHSWYYQSVVDEMNQAQTEVAEIVLPAKSASFYPEEWRDVKSRHVRNMLKAVQVKSCTGEVTPLVPDSWSRVDYAKIAQLSFLDRK